MPYLGRGLDKGNYLKLDDITSGFNGITTTFNLKAGGSAHYPGSGYSILVSLGGIIQEGESAYTINQDEITFASAPSAVDDCYIISLGVPIGIGVPGNSTVSGTKLTKPFSYDGYFYFDSTNDRVGIGSLTPQYDLDVVSTDTSIARLRSSSATGTQDSLLLQSNSATALRFQPNFQAANKYNWRLGAQTKIDNGFEITPSNNVGITNFDHPVIGIQTNQVGINTANPTEALHVFGNLNVTGIITGASFGGGIVADKIFEGNTAVETVDTGSNGHITFDTEGTERFRIGHAGVSTFLKDLHVAQAGTGSTVFINSTTHNTNVASVAMLKLGYTHSGGQAVGYLKLTEGGGNSFDGDLTFGVPYNKGSGQFGTRDPMTIKFNGNVGIGTNVPTSLFDVHMSDKSGINFTNSGNNAVLDFRANMVESAGRIRVDESSGGGYLDLYTKNTSGTLLKRVSITNDGDIEFIGTTAGVSSCTWDRSASVLKYIDGAKTIYGTGDDLEVYHVAGGDSIIHHTATSGSTLRLRSRGFTFKNQANNATIATLNEADACKLFFNNAEKIATTTRGITVTGEVVASQDFPTIQPTLNFNFAGTKKLDPRITYARSGSASYINEFGIVKPVGANIPRFDHDPITGESKGLLIEESRTNQMINSSNVTGATLYNGTITGNATTAPDGTTTADQFECSTANAMHRVDNAFTSGQIANSTAYSFSVFVKANGYDKLHIRYGGYGADNHGLGYDLSDGTTFAGKFDGTGALDPVTSSSMVAYHNGWYRCTFTFTTASNATSGTSTINYYVSNSESTTNFAGDGSSGMYFWGGQMEVGGFPTSYLPTDGQKATRGADQVTVSGSDFTDFYNDLEGTFAVSHSILSAVPDGRNCYVFEVSDGGSSHVAFRYNDVNSSFANKPAFHSVYNNSLSASMNATGTYTRGEIVKGAMTAKASSFKATWNGETIQTDGSGSLFGPGSTGQLAIGRYHPTPGYELNGHIQRMMYWPKQLSSNQLVNLTS